jgi:acetolactate synthase-1/2/3 large subunit
VPDDAIVVVDTGHAGMWMGGMYDPRSPRQSYLRRAGHLGWAFPAGLAAKCGAPDRPVVTFTGDAGLWHHIGEIETAVRWKINAVTVVNDNASGNQSKRGFDRACGGEQTEQARELWNVQPRQFRPHRRGDGRARATRRAACRLRARPGARARGRAAGRDRRHDRHRCHCPVAVT